MAVHAQQQGKAARDSSLLGRQASSRAHTHQLHAGAATAEQHGMTTARRTGSMMCLISTISGWRSRRSSLISRRMRVASVAAGKREARVGEPSMGGSTQTAVQL